MPDTEQVNKVDPVARMQFNPEVTVRMRGVMEKCTYCTQRISQVKIDSRNQWQRAQRGEHGFDRPEGTVTDAEVTTACQAACPTDCIVFGDLNDPDSRVSRLQQHNVRSYKLLEELNTRPRTRHMGLVRNPVHSPEASGH
jgi:molybdopterin-containing oxidoreductase family iron-sulfur binding subunit